MRKQVVTELKRVSIKKEGKIIETNTYIMTKYRFGLVWFLCLMAYQLFLQNTGEDRNKLYNREGQAIHTQSTTMLQLSEI